MTKIRAIILLYIERGGTINVHLIGQLEVLSNNYRFGSSGRFVVEYQMV